MSQAKQLASLRRITGLVLDQRLTALQVAERERTATKAKIAALDCITPPNDLSLASTERAQLLYQAWADGRRRHLNQTLAQQTVFSLECEASAREAFSRDAVLRALGDRSRGK